MIRVADTHSLLWFLDKNPRLSLPAREALEDAAMPLVVPAMVLGEIAFLHSRRRIALDVQTVLAAVRALPNSTIYPLDDTIAQVLPRVLARRLELHDAIIVATALVYGSLIEQEAAVITRDEEITACGLIPVIW